MIMIGDLKDLTTNRDGSQNVTVTVKSDFREEFDSLYGKPVRVEIKRYSKQRSLTANGYAWLLIDAIAQKMHMEKSFVYRMAIRDVPGVSEMIHVKTEKIPWIKRSWESKGLGWQVEVASEDINGWTCLMMYAGSSEYDTAQMSDLIHLLIQEAEGLGIPTITPREEAELMERWGKQRARAEPASA